MKTRHARRREKTLARLSVKRDVQAFRFGLDALTKSTSRKAARRLLGRELGLRYGVKAKLMKPRLLSAAAFSEIALRYQESIAKRDRQGR